MAKQRTSKKKTRTAKRHESSPSKNKSCAQQPRGRDPSGVKAVAGIATFTTSDLADHLYKTFLKWKSDPLELRRVHPKKLWTRYGLEIKSEEIPTEPGSTDFSSFTRQMKELAFQMLLEDGRLKEKEVVGRLFYKPVTKVPVTKVSLAAQRCELCRPPLTDAERAIFGVIEGKENPKLARQIAHESGRPLENTTKNALREKKTLRRYYGVKHYPGSGYYRE